jgi:hypothetical protein
MSEEKGDTFEQAADEIEMLCDDKQDLFKRVAELEHKQFHLLWMLEETGIDSSAAKQAECVLGDDCPHFIDRVAELEGALKDIASGYMDPYDQFQEGINYCARIAKQALGEHDD